MFFKKLLYFKTIVEQGQISRAARVLHVSQPPLSRQLKELEGEMGVTLIERSGTNWKVTPAGKALYRRALQILDLVDDIPNEIQVSQQEPEGRVSIGCTGLALSLFQRFVPHLHRRHPGVCVRLLVEDSDSLEYKLVEHTLDFAVMAPFRKKAEYEMTQLPESPLCIVAAFRMATEGIRAAARDGRPVPLTELHNQPLAVFRRSMGGIFNVVEEILLARKIEPRVIMESSSSLPLIHMLEGGLEAMALIPKSEVSERMRDTYLVCDLPDSFPRIGTCIVQVKNRYLSRAARAALDELMIFSGVHCALGCEGGEVIGGEIGKGVPGKRTHTEGRI